MFVVKSTIRNMSQLIDLNKLPWDPSKSKRITCFDLNQHQDNVLYMGTL